MLYKKKCLNIVKIRFLSILSALAIFLCVSCDTGVNVPPEKIPQAPETPDLPNGGGSGGENTESGNENDGESSGGSALPVLSVSLLPTGELPENCEFSGLKYIYAILSDTAGLGFTAHFTLSLSDLSTEENASVTVSAASYEKKEGTENFVSVLLNGKSEAVVLNAQLQSVELTVVFPQTAMTQRGEIPITLSYDKAFYDAKSPQKINMSVYAKGSNSDSVIKLISIFENGNTLKVEKPENDDYIVSLYDESYESASSTHTASLYIGLMGVEKAYMPVVSLESEHGVSVSDIKFDENDSNSVFLLLHFPPSNTPDTAIGDFTVCIDQPESMSYYSQLPLRIPVKTQRSAIKGSAVVASRALASSAFSYSIREKAANEFEIMYADSSFARISQSQEIPFVLELTGLQSIPITLTGSDGVSISQNHVSSNYNSADVVLNVPGRSRDTMHGEYTFTIQVSDYSSFFYDEEHSVRTISVTVIRKTPTLDSFAFIQAVKGKSFMRREGFDLHSYAFSADGTRLSHMQTTWQSAGASINSNPVEYFFEDVMSDMQAVFYRASDKNSQKNFTVTGTKLYEHNSLIGDSSFIDNGPTFTDRVAGKTFKSSDGTYLFEFNADGSSVRYWKKAWPSNTEKTYSFDKQGDNTTAGYRQKAAVFWGFRLTNNDTVLQTSTASLGSTDAILGAAIWSWDAQLVSDLFNPPEGTESEPLFITAAKGKSFMRREGLDLHVYAFSDRGDTLSYTKTVWQAGTTVDPVVTERYVYTSSGNENGVDTETAVFTNEGNSSVQNTYVVRDSTLYLGNSELGDCMFTDEGPTFLERVAGKRYVKGNVMYEFSADGKTLQYSDRYGVFGAGRSYTYTYDGYNTKSMTKGVYKTGRYWAIKLSDDALYLEGTNGDGISAYEAAEMRAFDSKYGATLVQ